MFWKPWDRYYKLVLSELSYKKWGMFLVIVEGVAEMGNVGVVTREYGSSVDYF